VRAPATRNGIAPTGFQLRGSPTALAPLTRTIGDRRSFPLPSFFPNALSCVVEDTGRKIFAFKCGFDLRRGKTARRDRAQILNVSGDRHQGRRTDARPSRNLLKRPSSGDKKSSVPSCASGCSSRNLLSWGRTRRSPCAGATTPRNFGPASPKAYRIRRAERPRWSETKLVFVRTSLPGIRFRRSPPLRFIQLSSLKTDRTGADLAARVAQTIRIKRQLVANIVKAAVQISVQIENRRMHRRNPQGKCQTHARPVESA